MEPKLVRIRVRGIYATALTNLFLKKGLQIVQASRIIADRFNIPQVPAAADVTVKDAENGTALLVIGYPEHAQKVIKVLEEELPYSFYWRSKLPLYATVKAEVKGWKDNTCIATVNDIEVEVVDHDECSEGQQILASIIKPGVKPYEKPRARPGARVVGDYAIVYECEGKNITFSEHIRSSNKRAELLTAATDIGEGICIHWRSSAQLISLEDAKKHLKELIDRLKEVRGKVEKSPPGTVVGGELVALIALSSIDKKKLDSLRREIIPTTPLHHTLKSLTPAMQDMVDLLDILSAKTSEKHVEEAIYTFLAQKLLGKKIPIYHVKMDGAEVRLGEAYVENVEYSEGRLLLTLKRNVRSRGVYDGLNIEKEPGDTIETIIDSSTWYVTHKYYSVSGEIKGVYININTPPEITPSQIRYLDLAVDIIRKPGEGAKIIDLDELAAAIRAKIVTDKMACKALATVSEIVGEEKLREEVEQLNKHREEVKEVLKRCNMESDGAGGGI